MIIKRLFYILTTLCLCFPLHYCEKDDICLNDNLNTPNLIIKFVDKENPTLPKSPNNLLIKALNTENSLGTSFGDSLALPLFIHDDFTQFEFILNAGDEAFENRDTVQINYQRKDQYLNSACGYRSTFILNNPPAYVLQSGNDWIEGFAILKDSITDETSAHLVILH